MTGTLLGSGSGFRVSAGSVVPGSGFRVVLAAVLCACGLPARACLVAGGSEQAPVFRSGTRLRSSRPSRVKDKDGKPDRGADREATSSSPKTASRRPSASSSSSGCRMTAAPPRRPRRRRRRSPPPAPLDACRADASRRSRSPPPGDTRYRDRRLLVLYFDLTAMPPPDQMRAYAARRSSSTTQMQPPDLLAIMTFEGGASASSRTSPTTARGCATSIQTLIFGDDKDGDGIPDNTDIGTAFGQDDARVQHPQHRSPAVGAADGGRRCCGRCPSRSR